MVTGNSALRAPTLADFELRRLLGKGGFAKVLSVRHRQKPNNFYALKCIKKDRVSKDTLLAERNLLIDLQSPFTTRLYATFQTSTHVFFVMERLYIDLFEVVFELVDGPLAEDWTQFYIAQLAMAVDFLHSRDVIHRDVKLDNLLLDGNGYLRLADFGLAHRGPRADNMSGTPEYMAPEMVARKEYGKEIDWWSVGVVLYVMLSGRFPFLGKDEAQQMQCINRAQYSCLRNVSRSGRGLLRGFLTKCPRSRTQSFESVRGHRWFRDFRWSDVADRTYPAPVRRSSKTYGQMSEEDKASLLNEPEPCNRIHKFDFVAADF